MAAKLMPAGAGSFIKSEGNGDYSRDIGVLVSGSGKVLAGTVLGRITTGGKLKPYDNDASDGSQTAIGVLVYDADATSADASVVIVARHAEMWTERLVWASTVLAGEKAPAYADLAVSGIVVR